LLLILASLKILEAHTARDFHVLVMIGWVLCLCAFLMSQDFAVALCVLGAFVLLCGALVQFHRRAASGGGVLRPLATAGKLLLQAVPLIVLLFLFFPRGTGGLRLRLIGSPAGTTGFSGEVSPGTIASVAASDELAFRVEFPDGNMPPRRSLYRRGAVLWEGEGLTWRVGEGLGHARPGERRGGAPIRQRITLEPHDGRWLFALDRPIAAPDKAVIVPGRYVRSVFRVSSVRRYEVTSVPNAAEDDLHPRERELTLRLPQSLSGEIRQLAQSWRAQNEDPRAVVNAALEFFRTQGFVYSISPGQYSGADALEEFLFRRKTGFCEHYAAAFTTLMRAADIPARIVIGYLGGQFNQFGNYLLVRQSDAHAWCEVWLPGSGWERVDPTGFVAPERLNLGSLRQMGATAVQSQRDPGAASSATQARPLGLLENGRLAWDTVAFAWDTRVLSFDTDTQREFFAELGLNALSGASIFLRIGLAIAAVLVAYALWTFWRSRPQSDAVKALYLDFCRQVEQRGAARLPTEGPADFARRAAELLPEHAQLIQQIARSYIALRYAARAEPSAFDSFAAGVRAFKEGRPP
ncbi:MAG TPA: DUF3488 and transglutaminase-like domain-containing protein, partial [Chthoniobacterales bacterium]|nr:DUF3488 and transglutaminase-like domain-containing protein [Chthoniobacterales bacterium]